jgi:tripartite ATP-independent transporter DctP family solute receptor
LYFADKVKEATNGKVIIDVFSDGVLGSETDVWEAIQAGTVDMGIISPAYVGNFVPEYQIYELPFLFASREHRDKVVNGPVGEKIDKLLADKVGMIVLGQFGGIGRNLITRTKKIETLDDIKGVKMRVYSSPIVVDTWTALGTVPVTVAYAEAYTGLQTGVVDAAENEMATLVSQKWYEPCKYVAITEHNINTRPLIIGKSQLEKLPKEYQEIMIEVGKDAASYAVKTERDDDAKYIDDLKNLNIEVFELQDKDKWIEATKQLRSDFVKKYNMEAILSEIEGLK